MAELCQEQSGAVGWFRTSAVPAVGAGVALADMEREEGRLQPDLRPLCIEPPLHRSVGLREPLQHLQPSVASAVKYDKYGKCNQVWQV